jgi:hypothetical protein
MLSSVCAVNGEELFLFCAIYVYGGDAVRHTFVINLRYRERRDG